MTDPKDCPDPSVHGRLYRCCPYCSWIEDEQAQHDATVLGVIPPRSESELDDFASPHDCATDGHDYQHIVSGYGELLMLACSACGRRWRVEPM